MLYEPKHTQIGGLSLKEGNHFVYPLWKQLLNRWLGDEKCKVYICSRHIDSERYADIATLAYRVCRIFRRILARLLYLKKSEGVIVAIVTYWVIL